MNVKGIIMDGNSGGGGAAGDSSWVVEDDDNNCDSVISIISSSEDDSIVCSSSTSSTSSSPYLSTSASSSSHSSNGPLYELSDLMNHLPIKRGLSMFYEGKTESFSCLGRVQSIEDVPKKESGPYRKRMKSCKSYEGGLDNTKRSVVSASHYSPKATIAKKAAASSSRGSSASARSFLGGTRPSSISVHKNYF